MLSNSQKLKGVITYLSKLTHTVDSFRFKFINIEVNYVTRGMISGAEIQYDLDITPKHPDTPYLWNFFNCKSKDIIKDGCRMTSINWNNLFTNVNNIYYNGEKLSRYGGDIPQSFIKKISNKIQQLGPKQVSAYFNCGGKQKILTLNITYELSDVYSDDGLQTDISVYCHQALVDGEPLENIPQDLAETIVGFMTEVNSLREPLDGIVWDEITQYMNLEDCEIWTHTYPYIKTIGDIVVSDYNYVNHSTFSSKMCDFMTGDY